MKVSEAKELVRSITQEYFAGGLVTFTRQSRIAKPELPLITLTPNNVNRPLHPNYEYGDEEFIGNYLSRLSFTVDLFTNGKAVTDEETGETVAYENTAVDDILSFINFLNSQYVIDWCHSNDVAILVDGDVQDFTGLINDNNYEFRAQITLQFYFTNTAVGYTGVLEFGTDGTTFEQTSTGGGSEDLANSDTGYFTEAEIKEENNNE